jgi:hypothetical protein
MTELVHNINSLRNKIKAETVISDLIIQGTVAENVIVEFASSHKNHWDKDILRCEKIGHKLHFTISRNGLFNSLPEYLFIHPMEGSAEEKERIQNLNKKQRINAEILLNPIENEIFQKSIALEIYENEILGLLNTDSLEELKWFWKIDEVIDDIYKAKLIKIIPFLHKIVGDFSMTAKCLSYFLEEKVSWSLEDRDNETGFQVRESSASLGVCSCGDDMVTGGAFIDSNTTLVFHIGPIHVSEIEKYLDNGSKRNLINYFKEYFLPFEFEIDHTLAIDESELDFFMGDSYLGFNTASYHTPKVAEEPQDLLFTLNDFVINQI